MSRAPDSGSSETLASGGVPGAVKTRKHGLNHLKEAVRRLGGRVVDRRTTLGKTLAQWRAELLRDLGGAEVVSTQERAIVELAVRTKLILDSIDAWLLTRSSLINARRRSLLPVVRERQQLADALARYLTTLGLERRTQRVTTLAEIVAAKRAKAGT